MSGTAAADSCSVGSGRKHNKPFACYILADDTVPARLTLPAWQGLLKGSTV